jgi:hypothetical protein
VITRLHFVSKHLKEQKEQTKTIAATYSKSVKTRALPKISKSAWAKCLALWIQEQVKYASDDARLSVLCQHLSDANDILAAVRLTDLHSLNNYLFRKYGSQSIILVTMLKDVVKNNKSPKNDIEEETSCNRLRSVAPFIVSPENYK